MSKRGFIFFILLPIILLLAGSYFLLFSGSTQQKKGDLAYFTPDTVPTNGGIVDERSLVEVPVLRSKQLKENDTINRFTVNITYPEVSLSGHPELATQANGIFKSFVDDQVAKYKRDMIEDEKLPIPKDLSSDLTMGFTPLLISPTILSLRFDSSEYIAGAAHPDNKTQIVNYDMATKARIGTGDLFLSSTTTLQFLSQFSRAALKSQLTDITPEEYAKQVIPGTEPSVDNFENVGITEDGLVVIFNPYRVAPYARGTIIVHIPFNTKGGELDPMVVRAIRLAHENIVQGTPVEN